MESWRELPQQRLDFRGHRRQDLVLQWAGSREELESRLRAAGWQPAPDLDLRGMLLWLNPQVELRELPVLPQIHDGSEDALTLVRYDDQSERPLGAALLGHRRTLARGRPADLGG
jgi:hypothetical protein